MILFRLKARILCQGISQSAWGYLRHISVNSKAQDNGQSFIDYIDLPGGKVPLTGQLTFIGGPLQGPRIATYRTIDMTGRPVEGSHVPHSLDRETAIKIYKTMATLQTMDTLFYEAQRQGRFSFYLTSQGEEATTVGSAAGLNPEDVVFAQYREQGVLLWRGYSLHQFSNQLFGNNLEPGKGRQMPIHYGSKELNYHTISSPLATQLPHAVGAAYALKLSRSKAVTVAYFGEGAASEGDAHAAFNFAATLEVPCIFICRNNGYAISTPASEQYRGDGIVARGPMYGISAIRVDGGDVRAMYNAVREARQLAVASCRPVLVEAMSYRSGHHSTSDDSSRYRTTDEMSSWRARDPVTRFRQWVQLQDWWSDKEEQALRVMTRQQVLEAMEAAAKVLKPAVSEMFTDVYSGSDLPWNLEEQYAETLKVLEHSPELKPSDMPIA